MKLIFNHFFSGDGCIFVWRLPQEMTSTMLNRLAQLNSASPAKSRAYIAMEQPQEQPPPQQPQPFKQPPKPEPEVFNNSIPARRPPPTLASSDNDYRFSVGKLPVWAKKQLAASPGSGSSDPDLPKGRWAARIGDRNVTVKSHYDSDSVIPFPGNMDIFGSKIGKKGKKFREITFHEFFCTFCGFYFSRIGDRGSCNHQIKLR